MGGRSGKGGWIFSCDALHWGGGTDKRCATRTRRDSVDEFITVIRSVLPFGIWFDVKGACCLLWADSHTHTRTRTKTSSKTFREHIPQKRRALFLGFWFLIACLNRRLPWVTNQKSYCRWDGGDWCFFFSFCSTGHFSRGSMITGRDVSVRFKGVGKNVVDTRLEERRERERVRLSVEK